MAITDELRKWAHGLNTYNRNELQVLAIADRIDAAHKEALSKVYMDMSDSEWVRLPKDADGETIHVGDELEDVDNPSSHGEVHRIELTPNACWVYVNGFGRTSNHYRHHRDPDTWERIIRDAIMRGADMQWKADDDSRMTDYFVPKDYDLVDRCKALAGDAE